MKTFIAIEKNGPGVLTFKALNYEDAEIYLVNTVIEPNGWSLEENEEDE